MRFHTWRLAQERKRSTAGEWILAGTPFLLWREKPRVWRVSESPWLLGQTAWGDAVRAWLAQHGFGERRYETRAQAAADLQTQLDLSGGPSRPGKPSFSR